MWLNKKYLPEVLGDTFDVPEDGSDEKGVLLFNIFPNQKWRILKPTIALRYVQTVFKSFGGKSPHSFT